VTTTSVGTSTLPLRVSWGPSGQVYQLQERVNDDGYESVTTGATVRITRTARNGYEYRYRVRAREADEWTDWATSPEVDVVRLSERHGSITYRGTWRSAASSKYIGGRVRYSTQRRAKATFQFTGRSIALIGPKGPTRGKAKIYVDGRYVKTISQYSSRYRSRQVFFARTWSKTGKHRVTILVLRTPGHPMVALDAIYVLR
jgi:hypothetical protein